MNAIQEFLLRGQLAAAKAKIEELKSGQTFRLLQREIGNQQDQIRVLEAELIRTGAENRALKAEVDRLNSKLDSTLLSGAMNAKKLLDIKNVLERGD